MSSRLAICTCDSLRFRLVTCQQTRRSKSTQSGLDAPKGYGLSPRLACLCPNVLVRVCRHAAASPCKRQTRHAWFYGRAQLHVCMLQLLQRKKSQSLRRLSLRRANKVAAASSGRGQQAGQACAAQGQATTCSALWAVTSWQQPVPSTPAGTHRRWSRSRTTS
jgi:hypothetical protein